MKTYIVDAQLYVMADDVSEAVAYAKQFIREVAERDAAGPGATGTWPDNEPWLTSAAVDNRAEEIE
jgi:hypothetical protein